jgi:hypothetical protein
MKENEHDSATGLCKQKRCYKKFYCVPTYVINPLLSLSKFQQNIKIHNINLSTNFHICVACIETNGLCEDYDN